MAGLEGLLADRLERGVGAISRSKGSDRSVIRGRVLRDTCNTSLGLPKFQCASWGTVSNSYVPCSEALSACSSIGPSLPPASPSQSESAVLVDVSSQVDWSAEGTCSGLYISIKSNGSVRPSSTNRTKMIKLG